MKCPKCQIDNREGVKFCEECGAKMEMECPSCGAKVSLCKKFFGECGHKLDTPTAAPAIDCTQPHFYTPKFMAQKILTTRSSIEGERKLVTVFFADVANYTNMSERLDPEEVHQVMDGCFQFCFPLYSYKVFMEATKTAIRGMKIRGSICMAL